jgi:hypothetical protein
MIAVAAYKFKITIAQKGTTHTKQNDQLVEFDILWRKQMQLLITPDRFHTHHRISMTTQQSAQYEHTITHRRRLRTSGTVQFRADGGDQCRHEQTDTYELKVRVPALARPHLVQHPHCTPHST